MRIKEAARNWWYGWRGPVYKVYKLKRWCYKQLARLGWFKGSCSGCSKTTNSFDTYYEWFICGNCSSDEVAYNLAEYVGNSIPYKY